MASRAELQKLSRDELIERAERESIKGVRLLTRDELIDELLKKGGSERGALARGLFGLARDLLSRVVERGLHLPDAAERFLASVPPPPPPRPVPAAIPTVTLADIYAAQGHTARAIETLKMVLQNEPDHASAKARLASLETPDYVAPPPKVPPESDEIAEPEQETPMLDDVPLPPRYDVDECVALPVTPTSLFVYWEVRTTTLATLHAARGQGPIVLEVVTITPSWDGPQIARKQIDVFGEVGDYTLEGLDPKALVRVAVGVRTAGVFVPIALSPLLRSETGETGATSRAPALVKMGHRGPVPLRAEELEGMVQHAAARQQVRLGGSSDLAHKTSSE